MTNLKNALYVRSAMNLEHKKRVLILGGTSEAIALASAIKTSDITSDITKDALEVMTSLAGRTQNPVVPGRVRRGGFGGTTGLTDYLQSHRIQALIDATHPFAAQISWNAAAAATMAGIPHLMLVRPPWEKAEGDRWIEVEHNPAAATALPGLANRVFLTIGRQELATYATLENLWFLMRMIDPPVADTPIPKGQLLLERGPFTLHDERSLLLEHNIEAIVSKNSGGAATYAKIIAARELNLPVVMVQRPPIPEVMQATTIPDTLRWLLDCLF
jgi:precorrin-6A/cobalt-precorrin-6A reductase